MTRWTLLIELEVEFDADNPEPDRVKWRDRVERQTGFRPRTKTIDTALLELTRRPPELFRTPASGPAVLPMLGEKGRRVG